MEASLQERAGAALRETGLQLALGESCTGGLIGHWITEVAGSSDYFLGGAIAYSNAAKESLLEVSHETLLKHGAVSEATAREMAEGARRAFGAGVGLSVTGIAGPGGGSAGKPVGLTWVAVSLADRTLAERHVFDGDRAANKRSAAEAALELLLKALAAR